MKNAIVSGVQTQPHAQTVKTPEEAIAMVEAMYPNDPGMAQYVKKVFEGVTVEKGIFTADHHDAASEKWTMTMTEKDVVAIFESNYVRSVLEQSLQMENPDLQGEELTGAVDKTLEEARQALENSKLNLVMTVYSADEDLTPAALEMTMDMTVTEAGETENVTMTMDYTRLTDANGVSYKAGMTMGENGTQLAEMLFELYRGVDDVTTGRFAMLADGGELTVLYNAANEADVRTRHIDLYFRSGAASIIPPSASDRPLIGLVIATSPADSAVMEAMDTADPQSAQDVMQLSESEWNALAGQLELNGMTALYAMLGQLPSSTMALVQSMMQ